MADVASIQIIVTLTNGDRGVSTAGGKSVDAIRKLVNRVGLPMTTQSVSSAVQVAMEACDPDQPRQVKPSPA